MTQDSPIITIVNQESEKTSNFPQLIRYHAQISSELPEMLSALVKIGKTDDVLRLVTEWGTHNKANSEVWKEAKQLLAKEDTRG